MREEIIDVTILGPDIFLCMPAQISRHVTINIISRNKK